MDTQVMGCDWEAELVSRAVNALDATHAVGERGPRTMGARLRIAAALDCVGTIRVADLRWLESVAKRTR